MLTVSGLGSGLDIKSLVSQLVAGERAGTDLQLNRQEAKYNQKFSALGSLKGVLGVFKDSISSLQNLSNYTGRIATSSDNTVFTASAGSGAVPNTYSIAVSQLAASHALASTAFADSDETAIGTGTLTIRRGTTDYVPGTDTYNGFLLNPDIPAANITINSSNNTLEGIMGAINEADIGVNASIVNDGSGFRLLLSSKETGEENSLELSVTDGDGNNTNNLGLSRLAFNASATHMEQTAAAVDANFTINGLGVSSTSNITSTAIPGVTLTLKKESASTVDLNVKADTAKITSSINSFVAGYNSYITTANNLSSYNAAQNIPAALLGDFTLRSIRGQVDSILRSSVAGLGTAISDLSDLGITTTSTGTLTVDSAKLNALIASDPQNVSQMFAAIGVPTDANVKYATSTEATVVGNYAVSVSALATSGALTGASVLPDFGGGGTVVIDNDNNNLTLTVDGINSGAITLTAGTYTTGDALADEIQVQINGATPLKDLGLAVTVTYDSGTDSFTITSPNLGSQSTVAITAVDTNSATSLGFSVASGTAGIDVAGSIGGHIATGTGNLLTGQTSKNPEGLGLVISGDTTGARGTVNFTRGIASQLSSLLNGLLEEEGALDSRIESYRDRIDDVAKRRAALELKWETVEERYSRQFNALDSLLSSLQSTSGYLTNQFENLPKPNSI